MTDPSTNRSGNGGRDSRGRFASGNLGGPGNPLGGLVAKLRAALIRAVKPADVKAIIRALLKRARAGDVETARLILSYTLGKPVEFDLLERLETIEKRLEGGV